MKISNRIAIIAHPEGFQRNQLNVWQQFKFPSQFQPKLLTPLSAVELVFGETATLIGIRQA